MVIGFSWKMEVKIVFAALSSIPKLEPGHTNNLSFVVADKVGFAPEVVLKVTAAGKVKGLFDTSLGPALKVKV